MSTARSALLFASVLVSSVLTASGANAQGAEFGFAAGLGGGSEQAGYGIAVDGSGNSYITGLFQGTADFNPGAATYNLSSAGGYDSFVCKLDASGNFGWAVRWGGPFDDYGLGIALDSAGNVYTSGLFQITVDFNPGPGTANLTSSGGFDVFVSKLTSSGGYVWAKAMGGAGQFDIGHGIAIDGSDNVYTAGYFQSIADFDPGAGIVNLTSDGSRDIFVSKLTSSGDFVWARRMGGTGDDIATAVAVDAAGAVFTTGSFFGTADFDPGAGTAELASVASTYDIFVSKLDASGNYAWANLTGGLGDDYGWGIAVDASLNAYTTGVFRDTVDFDPGAGTSNLISSGGEDMFVSKLTASGNYAWAKRMGGVLNDAGLAVAVDASGHVCTTGYFEDVVELQPGSGINLLQSAGYLDIFISRWDTLGNFTLARSMGSANAIDPYGDIGYGIAVDASGNPYTTGYFIDVADFDPEAGVIELTSAGSSDAFVSKLDLVTPAGLTVSITGPTAAATYATTASSVTLSGTASDNVGVGAVLWSNDRGASGIATGTASWSVSGVLVFEGANVFTLTAVDEEANTAKDTLTVTRDSISPTATITSPTSNPSHVASGTPMNLAGTAADNIAVTQVTWTNDRGGSGTASGTTAWSKTGIALQPGVNVIAVRAFDAAGSAGVDSLTVLLPTSISVTPALPLDADDLVCQVLNPLPATTYTFEWFSSVSATGPWIFQTEGATTTTKSVLSGGLTSVGEYWKCVVTSPWDDGIWPTVEEQVLITSSLPTVLSLAASPSSIALGQSTTLSGELETTGGSPVPFVLVDFDSSITPSGGTNTKPDAANTNGLGLYTRVFAPNEAGTWRLYSHWNGTGSYDPATSAEKTVTVTKATPTVSLTLSHTSAGTPFADLTARAVLDAALPTELRPLLNGRTIQLYLREPDNQTPAGLPLLASTVLDVETGGYVATFAPSAFANAGIAFDEAGTWQFQAHFLANTNFNAASSPNYDDPLTPRLTIKDGAGYAILVVGALDDTTGAAAGLGEGQIEHTKTMDFVYRTLVDRGLDHADIWYMREPVGAILPPPVFAGNPTVVDDSTPSQTDLHSRITTWARDKMNAQPAPLYLVAIDHGLEGKFYVFNSATGFGEARIVTPQELNGWYDTLQSTLNGVRGDATLNQAADQDLVVVYGACHSASFIPLMSSPGRVLIASCQTDELSHRGPVDPLDGVRDGELFVTEFFRELRNGKKIKESFELASARIEDFTLTSSNGADPNAVAPQRPVLDDNGDAIGHLSSDLVLEGYGDGAVAANISLGFGASNPGDSVGLLQVTPTVALAANGTLPTLTARATDDTALHQAWIEVKAPSYDGADPAATGTSGGGESLSLFQQEVILYHFDSLQNTGGNVSPPVNGDYTFPSSLIDDGSGLTLSQVTNPAGAYQVYYFIKDAASGEVASYLITSVYRNSAANDAPPAVSLLIPPNNFTVQDLNVLFAWTASLDPDGNPVTYRLELDSKDDPEQTTFVSADLIEEGITATAAAQHLLAGQTYFWRVIPVDPFGASPANHAVRRFTVTAANPGFPGFVAGAVTNTAGFPIPLFTVQIKDGATVLEEFTQVAAGAYASPAIDIAGFYDVRVTATGYNAELVSGVVVQEGGVSEVNIVMDSPTGGATTLGNALAMRNAFRIEDTNNDGLLSQSETGYTVAAFNALDKNLDGVLTLAELVAASVGQAGVADLAWVKFSHTGTETGQELTPFNTIEEGAAYAKPGGEVRVKTGTAPIAYTGGDAFGYQPAGLTAESFVLTAATGIVEIGNGAPRPKEGEAEDDAEGVVPFEPPPTSGSRETAPANFWQRIRDAFTGADP